MSLTLDSDKVKTMSEQNKRAQNYTDKPRICAGCCHYQSKIERIDTEYGQITEESERKCGLGGFTITMQGTCDFHNKTAPQIVGGFMKHTTIEYGTVINISDGQYSGLWESTKGGWKKL